MAIITPNVNNSQALITPGYPMAAVPKSSPLSTMLTVTSPPLAPQLPAGQSVERDAALAQAGDTSNRTV